MCSKDIHKGFPKNSLSHRLEDLEIGRWSPGCDTWVESCGGNATGGKLLGVRRSWYASMGCLMFLVDEFSPFGGWKLKILLLGGYGFHKPFTCAAFLEAPSIPSIWWVSRCHCRFLWSQQELSSEKVVLPLVISPFQPPSISEVEMEFSGRCDKR